MVEVLVLYLSFNAVMTGAAWREDYVARRAAGERQSPLHVNLGAFVFLTLTFLPVVAMLWIKGGTK